MKKYFIYFKNNKLIIYLNIFLLSLFSNIYFSTSAYSQECGTNNAKLNVKVEYATYLTYNFLGGQSAGVSCDDASILAEYVVSEMEIEFGDLGSTSDSLALITKKFADRIIPQNRNKLKNAILKNGKYGKNGLSAGSAAKLIYSAIRDMGDRNDQYFQFQESVVKPYIYNIEKYKEIIDSERYYRDGKIKFSCGSFVCITPQDGTRVSLQQGSIEERIYLSNSTNSDLTNEIKSQIAINPNTPNPQPTTEHWTGGVTGLDQSPASIFTVTTGGDTDTLPPSVGDTLAIDVTDPSSPTFQRAGIVQGRIQGKYQYSAWGEWNGSITINNGGTGQNTTFNRGLFVMGQPTPRSHVDQRTGSATYSGSLLGDYASRSTGVIANSVNGSVNLTANFSSRTMTGNLNMSGPNGFSANTTANAGFYNRGSNGVGYGGNLTGPNGNGGIDGTFFGPTAQETGGTFWFFTNTGENATGIFRAQD